MLIYQYSRSSYVNAFPKLFQRTAAAAHICQLYRSKNAWSAENKLELNPIKCKELRIDVKRNQQKFDPIKINNVPITNTLRWYMYLHVHNVIKKAN